MANKYRDAIASATQGFDTGIPVLSSTEINQIYKDLACRELEDDVNIQAYIELTPEEKERIGNVISTYVNENSNETCTE